MEIKFIKKCTLENNNDTGVVAEECRKYLAKAGFAEDDIDLFSGNVTGALNDYAEHFGEGTQIDYSIRRRLKRIDLQMAIPGESYDPFEEGSGAGQRTMDRLFRMNLNTETVGMAHDYVLGRNIVTVSIPLSSKRKSLAGDPMVWALVLGVALGLLCQHLPQEANSFIVDSLALPIQSIILKMISGIMGPVIFISMTTAIVALDDVNELTNLGFRMLKRFIRIILFAIGVSIAVCALFFHNFGDSSISFAPDQLIGMILDVLPTNLIEPFLENNTPQLVILGVLFGTALLILGDRVDELTEILMQINEWVMGAMKMILTITPAIPFLSIMTTIAQGNGRDMLEGWKFIAATYIIFTICVVFKAVKASMKTGISIPEFWRKIKPVVMIAFTTSSTAAPIKKAYEVSETEFGVKKEFSSFFVPMCSAMLSLKTTVNLVTATFMMAQISGTQISDSFLLVVILVTIELSIASPGTTGAWTVMFETFGMSTNYVGLFAGYRVFTVNYASACTMAYDMFEEVEAAYKLGGISEPGGTKGSDDGLGPGGASEE